MYDKYFNKYQKTKIIRQLNYCSKINIILCSIIELKTKSALLLLFFLLEKTLLL